MYHGTLTTFHRRDVKAIDMDFKIAELFEEERNGKTRDAHHMMPQARIPNLNWQDYMPPTVTEIDLIIVENMEIADCYCIECDKYREVAATEKEPSTRATGISQDTAPKNTTTHIKETPIEATHTTGDPVIRINTDRLWSTARSACRNIFHLVEEFSHYA